MRNFDRRNLTIDGVKYTKAKFVVRLRIVREHQELVQKRVAARRAGKRAVTRMKNEEIPDDVKARMAEQYPMLPPAAHGMLVRGTASVRVDKDGNAVLRENGTGKERTFHPALNQH